MQEAEVLRSAGCSEGVVAHCLAVSTLAVFIAGRTTVPVDRELVRLGGLFHDIGRSRTHGIDHAVAGVAIARELGFSKQLVLIIERHIGAGITAAEAGRLGLPRKDYLPLTAEEKLVSYADNLINGVRQMPFSEALARFKNLLGPDHESIGLLMNQHAEIQGWMR